MRLDLREKLRKRHDECMKRKYADCLHQHGHKDGEDCYCFGVMGGSSFTDFLDEGCIKCPYLKVLVSE